MGCGCKNAEGGCGCGTKYAEYPLINYYSHCADCGCGLDSKTHKMDTSGSVGGLGSSNGALCDSCFVHLKKTGNFNNPLSLTQYGAEEPVVQEPDWIPAGDGRAIGQQDFAINLSPLHAESRFDKLSNEIADEYEEKGMSPEKAQEVGDATAAKIGRAKYGKKGMMRMQRKGMRADMVGSPSPTFNEDITGQEGPSSTPTNASFAAFEGYSDRYDPAKYGHQDVKRFRSKLNSMGLSNIVWDIFLYNDAPSKKTGRPANKAYYVAIVEKNGNYYPIAGYGGMNKPSGFRFTNIHGGNDGAMASVPDMMQAWSIAQEQVSKKKKRQYRELPYRMNAESKGAETLTQIEGPTAEATSGGLHSPSSFDISWEDGNGLSSASMPPNEIAWAEDVKATETKIFGIGLGTILTGTLVFFGASKLVKMGMDRKKDDTKNAEKGCGCSKTVAKSETVKKHSEYSVNQINPVEVEGQNDIHSAESIRLPQPHAGPQTSHLQNQRRSLKMW